MPYLLSLHNKQLYHTFVTIANTSTSLRFSSFNNSKYVAYQNASQHITSGFIDVNKPTAICAHGYRGSAETQGTPKLIGALSQLDINVCAIDYPREADFGGVPFLNYPIVVNLSLMVRIHFFLKSI